MTAPTVPFVDLHAQYLTLKGEIDAAIAEVLRTSAFIRGPFVSAFEREFAAAFGMPHCVSCANGTDSLYLAMRALGLEAGGEVIAPANSWISTTETVSQAGGSVVFCDVDETYTLDVRRLEALVTPRTVGIIPVHLYGQACDMDAVMAIARRHGLWVLEDCAQSHLATFRGRLAGTFGDAASFSFYPSKNLGAMGDAGALLTARADLAERMAMLARHGGLNKGDHQVEGINSRLDGLQAAILSAKLPHLAAWTARRREIAADYDRRLAGLPGLALPVVAPGRDHVYHLYVVRHDARDELVAHLAGHGIQTAINYPVALPFVPAYARLGHAPADFPVSFANQSRIVSLPMYPEMTPSQIAQVSDAVAAFCHATT